MGGLEIFFLRSLEAAASSSSLPYYCSTTSRNEQDAPKEYKISARNLDAVGEVKVERQENNVGHRVERGIGVGRVQNVRLVGVVVTAGRLRGVLSLCVLRLAEQGRGALNVETLRPTDHG